MQRWSLNTPFQSVIKFLICAGLCNTAVLLGLDRTTYFVMKEFKEITLFNFTIYTWWQYLKQK